MPIYEYCCRFCLHQFEEIQSFSEEPLKVCPNCSQPGLDKLISNTSFQLKGTGWYVTDIRDKAKAKPEIENKAPDTSEKTANDAAKTDAKNENITPSSATVNTKESTQSGSKQKG